MLTRAAVTVPTFVPEYCSIPWILTIFRLLISELFDFWICFLVLDLGLAWKSYLSARNQYLEE